MPPPLPPPSPPLFSLSFLPPPSSSLRMVKTDDGLSCVEHLGERLKSGFSKTTCEHCRACAGRMHACPRLLRDIKSYPVWKLYQQEQDAVDAGEKERLDLILKSLPKEKRDLEPPLKRKWRSGRGTFLLLLEHITIEMRSKTCLSYFYCRLIKCFADHNVMLDNLLQMVLDAKDEWKQNCPLSPLPTLPESFTVDAIKLKQREVRGVFSFAKHHLSGHLVVGKHDGCAHHCVRHALGGCSETHDQDCHECGKLHRFGENMARFHQDWCNVLCRACEDHLPSFKKGARTARATENTVPSFKGRMVEKDFGAFGKFLGVVQSSDIDDKTDWPRHLPRPVHRRRLRGCQCG